MDAPEAAPRVGAVCSSAIRSCARRSSPTARKSRCQVVLREAELPWLNEIDLRGTEGPAQDERIREILRIERERGFDLADAPLMRVALVRLAERRYEMLWATHHLYIDGWSWPLVIGDLSEIYGALCDGREPSLPPACPYGRYIRWLEEESPDSEAFWKQELAGFTDSDAHRSGRRRRRRADGSDDPGEAGGHSPGWRDRIV